MNFALGVVVLIFARLEAADPPVVVNLKVARATSTSAALSMSNEGRQTSMQ
jgi:hypothetical protein